MLKIFLLLLLTLSAIGYDMNMRGTDDILKRMHQKSSKVGQRENGQLKAIGTRELSSKSDIKTETEVEEIKKDIAPIKKKVVKLSNGLIWENNSNEYITIQEYDSILKEFIELRYPQEVKAYNLEIQKQKAIEAKIKLQKEEEARARAKAKKQREEKARVQKEREAKARVQKEKEQKEQISQSQPKSHENKVIIEKETKLKVSKKSKKMKRNAEFVITPTKEIWQDNEGVKTTSLSWAKATEFCENLTIESYNDWRLPSKEELGSIVDKNNKPTINKAFQNIKAAHYWSKSVYKNSKYYVWIVDFNTGVSGGYSKEKIALVRCIRDGK